MSELSEEEIIETLEDRDDFIDTLYENYRQGTVKSFDKAIQGLLDLYQKEKQKNKEFKNALIYMVNQFADTDDNPRTKGSTDEKLYTEGLSALEKAFCVLDIDEGIKREDLYKLLEERN